MSITEPEGKFDIHTGLWVATKDWSVEISRGDTLHIRAGFQSDGASIPSFLWPVVGPRYAAKTFPAALAHDALYCGELVTRGRADSEFYGLLRRTGVGWAKAAACWSAVRTFGWVVWMRHSRMSIEEARRWVRLEPPVELVCAD